MSEYQYNKVTPEMIEKFKEIAPKRVLVGDEINEDFTHDEMAIYGKARPEVLVEATSTEEVAAVVKLCNENKVPVKPGSIPPFSKMIPQWWPICPVSKEGKK